MSTRADDGGPWPAHERFHVVRWLGAGGAGAVYEAIDRQDGSRIALKLLRDVRPESIARFKREFRLVADLHHPHLVKLFELIRYRHQWLISMELVGGGSLLTALLSHSDRNDTVDAPVPAEPSERVTPPPVVRACDPAVVTDVLAQIADGLDYLHTRGVVHGDLKPSNVLIDDAGRVRLADFGLSNGSAARSAISGGTPPYMAPELFPNGVPTRETDLYALGCVLFHLLTGHAPYGPPAARAIGRRPRVADCVDGVPAELATVCDELMSTHAAQRPTIAEVRERVGIVPSGRAHSPIVMPGHCVGRELERERLHACLRAAEDGVGQLALLVGDSGMGKTAEIERLITRARELGFIILCGRCHEREQVPFVAFDRVVDQLVELITRVGRHQLAVEATDVLRAAALFPALTPLAADAESGAETLLSIAPDSYRVQAFESLVQILVACQRRGPVLLVIDDAQWIDHDSVRLLDHLIRRFGGRFLLVLATRPEAVTESELLGQALRSLSGKAEIERVELPPLARAEVEDLITRAGVADIPPSLIEETEGNPFLLQLVLSGWRELRPGSMAALVDSRFRQLSQAADMLLATAVAAGAESDRDLLLRASGLPAAAFGLALHELVSQRVLRLVPASEQRPISVATYHDLVRRAVEQRLEPQRRRQIHHSIAAALEEGWVGELPVDDLLRHWTEAGDDHNRRRYLPLAAERAEARLAFERAARLRLAMLQEGVEPSTPVAWERVGTQFRSAGRVREAGEAYRHALQLWEGGHDASTLAVGIRLLGLNAESLLREGELEKSRALTTRGLALLGITDRVGTVRQMLTFGWVSATQPLAYWMAERRPLAIDDDVARASLQFLDMHVRTTQVIWPIAANELELRAERIAWRLRDRVNLAERAIMRVPGPVVFGRPTRASLESLRHQLDESAERAIADGMIHVAQSVQTAQALVLWPFERAEAIRSLSQRLRHLEGCGEEDTFEGVVGRAALMMALYLDGRSQQTLSAIDRELARARVDLVNRVLALFLRARVLASKGELRSASQALDQLASALDRTIPSLLDAFVVNARATAAIAEGEYQKAYDMALRQMRPAVRLILGQTDLLWSHWLEPLLEASLALGRRGQLSRVGEWRARRWARQLAATETFHLNCRGERALALLALYRNDRRAASRHAQRAIALSTDAGAHVRWLCLEAARAGGVLTTEGEQEAAAIVAREGYRLPPA